MSGSSALAEPSGLSPTVAVAAVDGTGSPRLHEVLTAAGLALVPDGEADVVLLECRAFRHSEADLVRATRRRLPGAQVIVVSQTADAARVRLALEAGANGFVTDQELATALGAVIAVVVAGQICLPAEYRRQVAKPTFTTREKQILGLVVMGLSNGEIGRRLFLAESTVKSHLSSAFTKLGVRSRNEATAIILDPSSGLGPGILRVTETLGPVGR